MSRVNICYSIVSCLMFVSCLQITNKKSSIDHVYDSYPDLIITPQSNVVIFLYPNEKTIESIKDRLGDDFYIIADDANYYNSVAIEFLESKNISYVSVCDSSQIIIRKKGFQDMVIDKKTDNSWYAILYNDTNHNYIISSLIDFESSYILLYETK